MARKSKVTIVRDVDNGFKRLLRITAGLKEFQPSIAVGILARDAGTAHGETTVLDVATWFEFGTRKKDGGTKQPARPWIRPWFDANRAEGMKRLTNLMRQVVAGKLSEEQALNKFGAWAQGSIQKRLAAGIPPPNARSTEKVKGSSTPGIDTGQMRSSVSYEIRR